MKIYSLTLILILCCVYSITAQTYTITTTDNVNLHVTVKGKGTPCLYLHGGPGSGSNWLGIFMGNELEKHFKMIYLDQRGVGRSTSPENHDYSMKRMVADFEEVRQYLGIDKWVLLGHSFGGLLQMGYIMEKPEAISHLIFLNGTLSLNDSFTNSWLPKAISLLNNEVPDVCKDKSVSAFKRISTIMPLLQEKDVMWKLFFHSKEAKNQLYATYAEFNSWNTDQTEHIFDFEEYWLDYSVFTKNIKQPVLFYYGKKDWAIGPTHYKTIEFPTMKLWGNNVGHMPFLEDKANLNEAITYFVNNYLN